MTPDHAYDRARALAAENRELRELPEAVDGASVRLPGAMWLASSAPA